MCQVPLTLKGNVNRIYLLSPNYPNVASGFKLNEMSCECVIRGTSITSITILDLRLQTSSDGTRSNLFIQYGDITYNKTSRENSQSALQIDNHRLQTTTTISADIIFTHQRINGLKLWIEIQGISLSGLCNNIPTTTVPPRTTTPFIYTPTPITPFIYTPRPDSTSSSSTQNKISTSTTTINNRPSSATPNPNTSSETSTEISQTATTRFDSAAQQTNNDTNIIIVLATLLSLSMVLVIVLFLMYRKGKLRCLNQPGNPGTENSRAITSSEPGTTYSTLSNVDRHNTDSAYQELQTRNSNSPYNNLPYSGTSEVEPGTNYSSLSDGNRLDKYNNSYQELQTRTPTSPYNNLPYTSEHHTYSNQ
ncbi:mucin-2 [Patella vulgata]|uniref:mucin-2 n=1 Tax=Patella vulgata TaxID=6465 RepID=UPI0021806757|nr:mucin-2 [Patella vulgata]